MSTKWVRFVRWKRNFFQSLKKKIVEHFKSVQNQKPIFLPSFLTAIVPWYWRFCITVNNVILRTLQILPRQLSRAVLSYIFMMCVVLWQKPQSTFVPTLNKNLLKRTIRFLSYSSFGYLFWAYSNRYLLKKFVTPYLFSRRSWSSLMNQYQSPRLKNSSGRKRLKVYQQKRKVYLNRLLHFPTSPINDKQVFFYCRSTLSLRLSLCLLKPKIKPPNVSCLTPMMPIFTSSIEMVDVKHKKKKVLTTKQFNRMNATLMTNRNKHLRMVYEVFMKKYALTPCNKRVHRPVSPYSSK